jgi:hypothetical protein
MSWDGTLSTADVGALMQSAKLMPAIVKFVLTACVGTLMHCAKMMPAEECLCECDSCYEKEMCHPMNHSGKTSKGAAVLY